MNRRFPIRWQVAALGTAVALAVWLAHRGTAGAAVAAAGAVLLTVGVVLEARRPGPGAAALVALAAAGFAGRTALEVRAIETRWDMVREDLVTHAGRRLDERLLAAVEAVQGLAAVASETASRPRTDAFTGLETAVRDGIERGVVVFDRADRPRVWAGRHRLTAEAAGPVVEASITPFYAVLVARRQGGAGSVEVAQLTLAADSAVPDREETLAAQFMRETGAGLRFFPPGRGPETRDVFDYCVPACGATDPHPDTLFAVQMLPPTQGAHRVVVEQAGMRRVAVLTLLLLVVLVVTGAPATRVAALGVAGVALVVTPAGSGIAPGGLFSPATYFRDTLGPFSSSAGALIVTAGVVLAGAVVGWRTGLRRHGAMVLPAALLIVAAPPVLHHLAQGISPPAGGVGIGLWMSWELALTTAGAAWLLLAGAALRPPNPLKAPPWMAPAAVVWTIAVAAIGFVVWDPGAGWPDWYGWVWLPAVMLAVQPAPPARVGATVGLVAGMAAAVLTWGAAAQGRLLLAARDVAGLRQEGDAIAVGLLERFGERLAARPVPRTAADLYARWSRSSLEADRYPALLAVWEPGGRLVAQLELADLDLDAGALRPVALAAASAGARQTQALTRLPGTHYILAVPFPDSSVVTVGLGPRSQAVPPVRVARFLKGEPVRSLPYDITLSALVPGESPRSAGGLLWRRVDGAVRGEERLELAGGVRHVHVRVPLGGFAPLAVRGALVLLLDVLVVTGLWLLADWVGGRLHLPAGLRRGLRRPGYRLRLAAALAVFFVVPTVGFAAWSGRRLAAEADRGRDLVIQQTLQDAAGSARDFVGLPEAQADERFEALARRLGADLLVYEGGALTLASAPVLEQLGLVDRYLPLSVYAGLIIGDELEMTIDRVVAGRATRVGYRSLGVAADQAAVLAAPRLVDDTELLREEEDLAFALLLVTLLGLAGAGGLAHLAARSLARPVQALSDAAERVGRGEMPGPFAPDMPGEFTPVLEAFERMARDVHASRALLEAQRRRTATVLENVATGVLALDGRLRVRIANRRAEELLGVALPVGEPVAAVTPIAWSEIWEWVRGTRAGATDPEAARDFSLGEREVRVQRASLGEDGGWVVALDDITELTHAVRVLAWGELARQIAHEIKNPLTPIRLGIQHLRRAYRAPRGDFDETLRQTSRQMLAEIERLDAIARAFSRFGAPPAEAEPLRVVNVTYVARDAAALYTLGEGPAIEVRGDGGVVGAARRDELKEVLINLIENARNAGASRIAITVEARPDERPRLTVQDDGQGIPPEHLPRIFEPQFSTTTSGSGMGLAICRRLVESWGGGIQVDSEHGRGTRVMIRFAENAENA